jgi:hypothetical protein
MGLQASQKMKMAACGLRMFVDVCGNHSSISLDFLHLSGASQRLL